MPGDVLLKEAPGTLQSGNSLDGGDASKKSRTDIARGNQVSFCRRKLKRKL